MKPSTLALLASACVVSALPQVLAEEIPLKPLTEAPASSQETFFKIEDGQAVVEGELIQLFVVKPEHVTVSYRNDTGKALFPKYIVRIYNRYGILLGAAKADVNLFGGSTKLEPGDVGGDKLRLDLVDVEEIFRHATPTLPGDFHQAAWLSVSDSNSQLGKASPTEAEQ